MPSTDTAARARGSLSLLWVQSVVCAVILLMALVIRLLGGPIYTQLQSALRSGMQAAGLSAWIAEQFPPDADGTAEPPAAAVGGADIPLGTAQSVKVPPNGMTLSPFPVAAQAAPITGGRVSSPYGWRTDPISGGTGFHTGTDVAAAVGTPLFSVWDGTVIRAAWDDGYGRYITVRGNNGAEVRYAHCSELLAREGDTVLAGQPIARVGNTGRSTGPHVHLMARFQGIWYDPAPLVAKT